MNPTCLALLLCDRVDRKSGTRKASPIGVFHSFELRRFPGSTAPFTITTKGSRTTIRRHGGGPPAPAGRTSSPPWDEIKHIFEQYPVTASKPKPKPIPKSKPKKKR